MISRKTTQLALAGLISASVFCAVPLSANTNQKPSDGALQNSTKKLQTVSKAERERARSYFTDTVLTTQDGKDVRFYSDVLDGNIVAINVMYTSCKGACPMQTQKMAQISRELGELYGSQVRFVSLSNDAERDTPQALRTFAEKQGVDLKGWTFLTGNKNDIDPVIKKLGLFSSSFEQHTSMILIGNTRTGHWKKIPPTLPYQAITFRLKELANET